MFIFSSGNQESFYEMQDKINRKLRSLRRLGLVLAVALVVLGIVLLFCPQSVVLWIERGIAVILGLVGIVEILDYLSTSALFRQSLTIVRGLFDLLIAVLLLRADAEMVITVFAVLLGVSAIVIGIHKLDYAMKLNYFRVEGFPAWRRRRRAFGVAAFVFCQSVKLGDRADDADCGILYTGRHRVVYRNAFL